MFKFYVGFFMFKFYVTVSINSASPECQWI